MNFFEEITYFFLIYANNKHKITTKKNIVMSYNLYRKNSEKKLEFIRFQVVSVSRNGPGSGSIIPEADPPIRIRIKMKRIQNTALQIQYNYVKVLAVLHSDRMDLTVVFEAVELTVLMEKNNRFYHVAGLVAGIYIF